MKRSFYKVLAFEVLAVVAAFAVSGLAGAAEMKIGVVSYSRLLQESPQAKAAQDILRNEFANRQRELTAQQTALKSKEEKLQKDGATMTADQRSKAEKDLRDGSREYQAKVTAYQEDFTARQNEELSKLQRQLIDVVQNYAAAQKFDLVLADGVIYATGSLDITSNVLGSLQGAKPAAPATPPAAPK